MDYDINNQQMLSAGAYYQSHTQAQGDWRSMDSAPRDGSTIEVRCTYGVAPWFGLYHWTDEMNYRDQSGALHQMRGQSKRWGKVGDEGMGFDEGPSFSWRPYRGDAAHYQDPTGGAQNSMAYWRGAVAAKYGLPLNTFERETQENLSKDSAKPKRPFWKFGR
jgi:hypothetical protein